MWLGVHISVDGPPMQVHASSKACLPSARYQGCSAGDVCLLLEFVHNLTFFARRREFHIVDEVAVQNLTFHEGISAPRMFYQVLHQGAPTGCKRQNDQVDWRQIFQRQVYLKPTSTFFDTNIRQIGHYFVHFEHYKWNDSLMVYLKDLLYTAEFRNDVCKKLRSVKWKTGSSPTLASTVSKSSTLTKEKKLKISPRTKKGLEYRPF